MPGGTAGKVVLADLVGDRFTRDVRRFVGERNGDAGNDAVRVPHGASNASCELLGATAAAPARTSNEQTASLKRLAMASSPNTVVATATTSEQQRERPDEALGTRMKSDWSSNGYVNGAYSRGDPIRRNGQKRLFHILARRRAMLLARRRDVGPFAQTGANAVYQRGLTALHQFEYEDANEASIQARQIDPGFAMAYWGEAMT